MGIEDSGAHPKVEAASVHVAVDAVRRFEAFVAMSMRTWLNQLRRGEAVDSRLAKHGFALHDAKEIHKQTADLLQDDTTQFATLQRLLGAGEEQSEAWTFRSVFWPEFSFVVRAGRDGGVDLARYVHGRHTPLRADAPRTVPLWSCDAKGFAQRFGPLTFAELLPIDHAVLPCYESHDFEWGGESYSATFQWGLFLLAAQHWD